MKCREDHAYPLDDQEILKLTEVLFPTLSDWRLTAPDGSLHAASPFVTHINLRTNWDRLSAREQRVMRLLNGIDGIDIGRERATLEVATILSVKEARVIAVQQRALKKLKTGFVQSVLGGR